MQQCPGAPKKKQLYHTPHVLTHLRLRPRNLEKEFDREGLVLKVSGEIFREARRRIHAEIGALHCDEETVDALENEFSILTAQMKVWELKWYRARRQLEELKKTLE